MPSIRELGRIEGQALANAALYPTVKKLEEQTRTLTGIVAQLLGQLRENEVLKEGDVGRIVCLADELMDHPHMSRTNDLLTNIFHHARNYCDFVDPIDDEMAAEREAREAAGT